MTSIAIVVFLYVIIAIALVNTLSTELDLVQLGQYVTVDDRLSPISPNGEYDNS